MIKALYVSYDGLLDPLGQSQVLPYVEALAKSHEITVLSFEKNERSKDEINNLKKRLSAQ